MFRVIKIKDLGDLVARLIVEGKPVPESYPLTTVLQPAHAIKRD